MPEITAYRIKDWEIEFENNRTRELKDLHWFPCPNKHDGDGYTQIMSHEHAPEIFSAWILLCQVASKCEPRGLLVREGRNGIIVPHDEGSLSRMTRLPVCCFAKSFAVLTEVGWLEEVQYNTEDRVISRGDTVISHDPASISHRPALNRIEEKGIEGNRKESGPLMDRFEVFWNAYSKKVKRAKVVKIWKRIRPDDDLFMRMLASIEKAKQSDQWKKGYQPHPTTWLNAEQWDDDIDAYNKPAGEQPQTREDKAKAMRGEG